MDDTQIVALFFARDERALEETAQRYGPRLRALALVTPSAAQHSAKYGRFSSNNPAFHPIFTSPN